MKKGVAILGVVLILLGMTLTACGGSEKTQTTLPVSDNALFKESPADDGVFRVLMIGNSLCYYFADELYGMLATAGVKAEVYFVYYSGCSIKQHWTWLNDGSANYQFNRVDSNGRQTYEGYTLETCIRHQNWDVVTLQQAVWMDQAGDHQKVKEGTLPYAKNLFDYLRERFPQARFLWHETWAFQVGFTPLGEDPDKVAPNRKVKSVEEQNVYYEAIRAVGEAVCAENGVDIIPTGDAWQLARKDPLIGDVLCARLGVNGNLGDYGHDGDIGGGQYLNACVWFEILTGDSCVGNTFRPSQYELAEEKIQTLQKCAHQAVQDLQK